MTEEKTTEVEKKDEKEVAKRGPGRPKKKKVIFELRHHRKGCEEKYGEILEGGKQSHSIEKLIDDGNVVFEPTVSGSKMIRARAVCPKCNYQITVRELSENYFWGNDVRPVK